jgi:hypothetical protein
MPNLLPVNLISLSAPPPSAKTKELFGEFARL